MVKEGSRGLKGDQRYTIKHMQIIYYRLETIWRSKCLIKCVNTH